MATRQDDLILVRKKIRIGDLLVEQGVITGEQLDIALSEQQHTGQKLGEILIQQGFIKETMFLDFLSKQLGVPRVKLSDFEFNRDLVDLLPETHAMHFRSLVLREMGEALLVGMVEPTDLFAIDELSRILKRPIRTAIVSESELQHAVNMLYHTSGDISSIAEELGVELSDESQASEKSDGSEDISGAPVVRLLQSIFMEAAKMNASDIHIEPDEKVLRIRNRIDGVLHEQIMNEKKVASALVSRIKLMAGLDIAEKRLPQDGRFNIKLKNKSIDVRLSTMPVQFGESAVMRLRDNSTGILSMNELGIPENILKRIKKIINSPHGMMLVTGPTGSGKTTTLYAALSALNTADRKIITVEDPVEDRIPRINQVQIKPKIGLTFAKVLRTTLRQDPDVIMVGEMRDQETAEIGLRAAMTGHFVLSTLHTNDAVSTALRLIDMGAESYLVASALRAVVAQRLVRKICEKCIEPYQVDEHHKVWLRAIVGERADSIQFKHGKGCTQCNKTGYRGRMGVYELVEINEEMADMLRQKDSIGFSKAAKKDPGYISFAHCALGYAEQGITTLEEVLRISDGLDVS